MAEQPELNPSHKGALTAALVDLGRALGRIAEVVESEARCPEPVERVVTTLSQNQRLRIRDLGRQLRHEMGVLMEEFGLSAPTRLDRQIILGHLTAASDGLQETKAQSLRAYGPLEPALGDRLDARLAQFLDLIAEIEKVATEADRR